MMMRVLRWMTSLWLLWIVVFGGFILLRRGHDSELMLVQIIGEHYLIDFETGLKISTPSPPPPLADAMSPDDQYIVTVVGSPRGSSYRLMHNASQTSTMIGPYRSPLGARTPLFWSDASHLWLVTLSRDGSQTILRGVDPAIPENVSDYFVYDFPSYMVRLSPNRQWLLLGTAAYKTEGIAHSVYDVAVANVETGELVHLGVADSVRVGWSNNSEWVVTQVRDDMADNPLLIRWQHIPTGRTFTTRAAAFERDVVWSRNGDFAAYRIEAANGDYQLYLLNLVTLETRLIMAGDTAANLYWCGDVLLVEAFTYPERTIYRVEADGLHVLATLPQASFLPLLFSPDEQYILYHLRYEREFLVYRLHIASGRHERLSSFANMPISIEWE
jgi:hypothetical protein